MEVCFIESPSGLCEEGARIVEGFAIRAGESRAAEFADSLPDVILQPLDLAAQRGFLPELLQEISVIFYLKSLCPVAVPAAIALDRGNPLALISVNPAPASPATAILGLLILSVVVLAFSSLQVRRMQIDYGAE